MLSGNDKACSAMSECPTQRPETVGDQDYQLSFCTDGFCSCMEGMNFFATETAEYTSAGSSWTEECKFKSDCESGLNMCIYNSRYQFCIYFTFKEAYL